MSGRVLVFVLLLLAPYPVLADPAERPPATPSQACRQAIAAAERAHGIPSHLLAAIARVESGRRDPASGSFDPWPWTIDMDGQGTFYDNKTQAVAAAEAMRVRVVTSIDVGCMQISLTYHPDAFSDMGQAFDPAANADYAARLLVQLYGKANSWPRAVELYHSATPEIGQEYGRRVYAALPEEQKLVDAAPAAPAMGGFAVSVNRFLLSLPPRQNTPHIIPLAAGPGGNTPPGRTLDSYRAAPVRLAVRSP